ncbi:MULTISPECIES: hypothetical protein [Bradyrhizobium]|uniref:hypothetical protein n=1 Tax=Bradyrhizobium pachyrhizi TaxID=280333 RepID=UPI0003FE037C
MQAIGTLEISRKGCRAHSPREQAFVGYLLRRMSALKLNARNLTLRGATKCLLSLPNFLRHAICSVYGIITNRSALVFGTDTASLFASGPSDDNDLALGCGPRKCREVLDAI